MSFDATLRYSEVLLSLAYLQQSAEHLVGLRSERYLFSVRFALALYLLFGINPAAAESMLLLLGLLILRHFDGPYNGGSDRMSLLMLICLWLAHSLPTVYWRELALGYLAVQLTLSYWISGWVKIVNPDWRNGSALRDVFAYSAYPVSRELRQLAAYPTLLCTASWAVMLLELLFPLALVHAETLLPALLLTAGFHLANALVFGLNRFVWIWISAYPSLIWLQARIFGG